jgi:hypothetical protein
LKTASGKQRGKQTAKIGGKRAGVIGKTSKPKANLKQKTSAKYKLTPSRLNEKLTEYDHSKAMRAIMNNTSPYSKESKRRTQTVKTARNAEAFRNSLQAEAAGHFKEAGKDWAKATAKAFRERPKYSTKQKVRRNWGPRTNASMTRVKGW